MSDRVRVKLANGSEATLPKAYAENEGLKILDGKPAVDSFGRDLPAKYPATTHGGNAAESSKEK